MNQASVGFQCPDCVRAGRAEQRSPRTSFGGAAQLRPAAVTIVLIALNVGVYFLVNATGGINGSVGPRLVLVPSNVGYAPSLHLAGVAQGDYWTLITCTFTHFEILHIAMNMIGLWIFGSFLEHELGRARYLALYLVTGLVGSVGVYLIASPQVAAFGASGSVFGLFAASFLVLRRQHRDITQLLVLLVLNLVISFTVPGIAWEAHVGGLIAGAVIGAAYVYPPRPRRMPVQLITYAVVLLVCVVVVSLRTAALTT